MRKAPVIFLLAAAVFVSGCVDPDSETDNTAADHSVSCSALSIDIAYADGEVARVVNLGSNSFGNISITWNYANGGRITKEFNTPDAGTTETFRSNSSGTVKGVMVIHDQCPSRTDSI